MLYFTHSQLDAEFSNESDGTKIVFFKNLRLINFFSRYGSDLPKYSTFYQKRRNHKKKKKKKNKDNTSNRYIYALCY